MEDLFEIYLMNLDAEAAKLYNEIRSAKTVDVGYNILNSIVIPEIQKMHAYRILPRYLQKCLRADTITPELQLMMSIARSKSEYDKYKRIHLVWQTKYLILWILFLTKKVSSVPDVMAEMTDCTPYNMNLVERYLGTYK